MPEDQLLEFLAKVKEDAEFLEKLKGAADLDAALAMAKEAGFGLAKPDLLRYQVNQTFELSDKELEAVAGGGFCPEIGDLNTWELHETCGQ